MRRGLALSVAGTAALAALTQPLPASARQVLLTEPATTVNQVVVVDTQTNQIVGSPIPVGTNPHGVAITPDGQRAYVS